MEQATESFLELVINLQPTTENIPNIHVTYNVWDNLLCCGLQYNL
jgi:hypothetical protein